MELCELGLDNIEEIKKIFLKIFSAEPWNDCWEDKQLHQYILELIGNSNSLSFGLYEGGTLIGISLGRIKHWCQGTEYWIDEFGILPEMQGQGFGSEFLKEIERALVKKGIPAIVLLTERTVPAYRFYQKCGFQEQEEQVLFAKAIY